MFPSYIPASTSSKRKKRRKTFLDDFNFRADFVMPFEQEQQKEEEEQKKTTDAWPASFAELVSDNPVRAGRRWKGRRL
jgi:hypothetical protein